MSYPHHLHHSHREFPQLVPHEGQVVEIILMYDELKHDIETDFHRLERLRDMKDKPILSPDGSDEYTLRREIDNGLNKVVTVMSAYLALPSPFVRRISTNHAHEWKEKNIYVALPYNWPMHNVDGLRDSIHTYIVKAAEFALLAVALPQDAYTVGCRDMSYESLNAVNHNINDRRGPIKTHPTWLG